MSQQAKAGIWFIFCSFFQKGIAFITIPLFTRLLTTEEYGITNLFSTWSTILMLFATLSLYGDVYSRGLLEFNEKKFTSSIQGLATTSTIIVTAIVLIFNDFISDISGLSKPIIFLMCIYFFAITGINLWTVKQRFYYRYKALIITTVINTILSTSLGIIAILLSTENKGEAKVIWSTIGLIAVALPFYIYNFRNGKKYFNKKIWKFSLSFNLPLLPHYLSNLILHQSDRVMINWFKGASDVAYYSVAYSIASIVLILTDTINQTLTPWRFQNMKKHNYSRINKISLSILALVAGLIILINLMAPEIIQLFGGATYAEAVWVIPPVILSVFFIFLYGMFSNIEFYYLKTKFMMVASVFSAALNIALNYIYINKYGYIACAYTTLFCYIIYTLCHYLYMRHILKKKIGRPTIFNTKLIFLLALITCILTAISAILYNLNAVRYILVLIIMIIAIVNRKTITSLFKLKTNESK